MSQIAYVTGSSSGIGYELTLLLLAQDYEVVGISRTSAGIHHEHFHEILLDLSNPLALQEYLTNITKEDGFHCDLLVNNAGCGYYGLHENLSACSLSEMVHTNLLAPLLWTNAFLRKMKEHGGIVVNLSSYTASHVSPHGAAYAATKSALSSFSESIYEEGRKHGLRVILVEPEMTDTNLYRHADFTASPQTGCHLEAKEVAWQILSAIRSNIGYIRLLLEPQYRRIERKHDI